MRLLVSVRSAGEASAAIDGGADLIDAKDPAAGALGAVSMRTMREIYSIAGGMREVTAALGDASDEAAIERAALAFSGIGASLVKVGFAGIASAVRAAALLSATIDGARSGHPSAGVIAVAYADAADDGIMPDALVRIAAEAGAAGVLLDTVDKRGPGLRALMPARTLTEWVARVQGEGLIAAVAGRLTIGDLPVVRDSGADVVGVRGAACDGDRHGRVSARRVRDLAATCGRCGDR